MDPKNDTPENLKTYIHKHHPNFDRWFFLTGDHKHIVDVSQNQFRVPASLQPEAHSTYFLLLDSSRRIISYYDGSDQNNITKIIKDTKSMLIKAKS